MKKCALCLHPLCMRQLIDGGAKTKISIEDIGMKRSCYATDAVIFIQSPILYREPGKGL